MVNFITILCIFAASLASANAIERRLVGKPTGMLSPRKKRQLEQTLNYQMEEKVFGKGATKNNEERDLGWYQNMMGGNMSPVYHGYGGYPAYMKSKKDSKSKKGNYGSYSGYGVIAKGKGNGKGMWTGMGGKKSSGTGTAIASDDCRYSKTIVKNPFNDVDEIYCDDDDCEMFITAEHFRFQEFNTNITNSGNTQNPGTLYVWEPQLIEDSDGNVDTSTMTLIQGQCVRTAGVNSTYGAAGQCTFTILDSSGDQLGFSGVLTSIGGTLPVTGGSGTFAGIIGDAHFTVVSIGDQDPFDDAVFYEVELTLGLIVCPAQYLGN